MRFVALVSGGKDSCFNIAHCLHAGHELAAVANLRPRGGRPEEIDSYMYQTVGHGSVERLAECAGVPLFRAEISEDEDRVVDELAAFLMRIKAAAGVDGVSVGAIGSSYQQQRVDKACARAGLRSLAYMWQRDQRELLDEIVAAGVDARIVKVASMGLHARHLGQPLAAIRDELLALPIHPCGEGGEYETFVLDAPFFQQRLEFTSSRVVQHAADDVFYLQFEVRVSDRPPAAAPALRVPPLLEPRFQAIGEHPDAARPPVLADVPQRGPLRDESDQQLLAHTFVGDFAGPHSIFPSVLRCLRESDPETCVHVFVVLRDMAVFGAMNAEYSRAFDAAGFDLPPSRTCIEAKVEADITLTLLCTRRRDASARGVHVQGLSYWAPASIGPYSQCRLAFGISYAAGQIGLVPQSLDLATTFAEQAPLALQHAIRILNLVHERESNWDARLAIVYVTDAALVPRARDMWARFASLKPASRVPLVAAVVPRLPRGAVVEWSLQACDRRYFQFFVPDAEEDEPYYSEAPEVLYLNAAAAEYTHRAGFQVLQVAQNLPEPVLVLGDTPAASGQYVPSSEVYFNETRVARVCVQ